MWIGTDALILSGVNVADGAIIAARSVVTRDIPPYAIVAGVPARVIRSRFDETTMDALLQIAWWDWPEADIERMIPLLSSPDVDVLLAEMKKREPR